MTRSATEGSAVTITDRLAAHIAATTLPDIPCDAVRAATGVMLDTIGVAWAGADAPGAQPVRDLAVREGGAADATVFAHWDRVPAAAAALVNGTFAGGLDYDCLHAPSVMHCDIVILPAVLAVAERQGARGADFLAALVLGNDIACRLGLSTCENRGWFYSSLYGGIAAAAVCARLLGLAAPGIRNAMGIAFSSAAGSRQTIIERRLTKRMQTAFAAQAGVQAALLAAAGVSGPAGILEGEAGIWQLYENGDPAPVLAELGRRYTNVEISLKKFPSCACNHAAAEAAIRIVRDHKLCAADIARARVVITPYMNRITGGAFRPGDTPQVDAQFNVSYSVAAALLRGRLGIDDILPAMIFDPAVAAMIDRIEVMVDGSLDTLLVPATVEVTTTDGRQLCECVTKLPGSPEAPLSEADIEEKFRACVGRGAAPLDAARARMLMERIRSVACLDDMRHFFDGIRPNPAATREAATSSRIRPGPAARALPA